MPVDNMKSETAQKFWKLIDDNRTCMMVSESGAKKLHGRPMHAIPKPDSNEIWFYTRLASGKSEELQADGDVCLAFSDPGSSDYVSASGHASISTDRAMIKEHWSRFVDAWFPEGPDGADVGMICVKVDAGEYWDGNSSRVLSALKMIVASERDELPDLGESSKVSL